MSQIVTAIYEDGVLRPLQPLPYVKPKIVLHCYCLKEEPRLNVATLGEVGIRDAIMAKLELVLSKTEGHPHSLSELEAMIDLTKAWITWQQIKKVIQTQLETFEIDTNSTKASIKRIANSVINAVERH